MKTTKLKLNKFKIAKLTGTHHVIGGTKYTDDPTPSADCNTTTVTNTTSPENPVCILTSQQFIEPPTNGNG